MKLFAARLSGCYAGGMAVVATDDVGAVPRFIQAVEDACQCAVNVDEVVLIGTALPGQTEGVVKYVWVEE